MSKPANRDQMYAEFGFTSHIAQLLELEIGNTALHFKTLAISFAKATPENEQVLRDITTEVNKKTLGALLGQVRKMVELDNSSIDLLNKALEKRNHLAHSFFRKHNFAINTVEGCSQMFDELKSMQKTLMEALRNVSTINEQLDKEAGRLDAKQLGADLAAKAQRIEI